MKERVEKYALQRLSDHWQPRDSRSKQKEMLILAQDLSLTVDHCNQVNVKQRS